MKKIALLILALSLFSFNHLTTMKKNFHDFSVKTLEGTSFEFSSLKGKKVLLVNTASQCGYTPQYEKLEALYKKYKDKNFIIVGFPSNDFGAQEPGTNSEIRQFCTKNYGVTFPMMEKICVKGKEMHEIYRWLTQKSENGVLDSDVRWNFQKYLIDENGNLVATYPSGESPLGDKITKWIEGN